MVKILVGSKWGSTFTVKSRDKRPGNLFADGTSEAVSIEDLKEEEAERVAEKVESVREKILKQKGIKTDE